MTTESSKGDWHVTHRIYLRAAPDLASAKDIIAELKEMDGVESVKVVRRRIKVCYDLTQTTYQTLCEHVTGLGHALDRSWPWRWLASWHQSTDETGRENANLPPAHCCNRVPRV